MLRGVETSIFKQVGLRQQQREKQNGDETSLVETVQKQIRNGAERIQEATGREDGRKRCAKTAPGPGDL